MLGINAEKAVQTYPHRKYAHTINWSKTAARRIVMLLECVRNYHATTHFQNSQDSMALKVGCPELWWWVKLA